MHQFFSFFFTSNNLLEDITHLFPVHLFSAPWKGFLGFSGGWERVHWNKWVNANIAIYTTSVIRQKCKSHLKTEVTKTKGKFFKKQTFFYSLIYRGKKCLFIGKFGVLCFPVTSVLRFALLPNYWRLLLLVSLHRSIHREIKYQTWSSCSLRFRIWSQRTW